MIPHQKGVTSKVCTALTTGVLNRNSNTVAAHVELANFNSEDVRHVTVYFYNWDTSPPTLIKSFRLSLALSSNTPLDVLFTSFHYEVRAIFDGCDDGVIINCFGRDDNYVFQEGNTVLFKELVVLDDLL